MMSTIIAPTESNAVVLHFGPLLKRLSDEEFFEFCQLNSEWRIERTSEGDLIIMPPTGSETGGRNFILTAKFSVWVEQDGTGKGFDSSTGFTLSNEAMRSPDLSWIRLERWDALTKEEQKKFAPICPDFVLELRSETDALEMLRAKMEEYLASGAQLGWLIDPLERKVYVYRPQRPVEILDDPESVSGSPVLAGFVLDMESIWE